MTIEPGVRFRPPSGATWKPVSEWQAVDWICWLSQHEWTPSEISDYLDYDRYHFGFGITTDGRRADDSDIGDESVIWLYQPTPRGVTLHESTTANLCWGGAAGGAKSYSARWEALRCCDSRDDFNAIMVRREREELRRTHLKKLDREIFRLNQAYKSQVFRVTGNPPVLSHARTGATLWFGHCNNPGDEEKYLSEDYDLFVGDEATQLLTGQITGIASRIRNDTKLGQVGRMILTTNPGGPSHDYCVSHFITKAVSQRDNPKYEPDDYTFVQSSLYDNPFYMDPDGTYATYEKRLYAREPERRKQLLNGDWGVRVGQYFSDGLRVERVEVSRDIPRLGAMQWGDKLPGMFLWAVPLPDGRLYIEREHEFQDTVAAEVALQIRGITGLCGLTLRASYGNREMGDAEGGEDIFETLQRSGLVVMAAKHDPVIGWQRLKHWMRPMADGKAALIVSPDCQTLARTLPQQVSAKNNREDIEPTDTQHAVKALRYLVMSRPKPVVLRSEKVYPPNSAGRLMQELISSQTSHVLGRHNVNR